MSSNYERELDGRSNFKSGHYVINCGGRRFLVTEKVARRARWGPLRDIVEMKENHPSYDHELGDFFFDRHPATFQVVLNYFRLGELHPVTSQCEALMQNELVYWGIEEWEVESCCWDKYQKKIAYLNYEQTLTEHIRKDIERRYGKTTDIEKTDLNATDQVWEFLTNPHSSMPAKALFFVSTTIVLATIVTYVLSTHPTFQLPLTASGSITFCARNYSQKQIKTETKPMPILQYIDVLALIYLTMEFVLKLSVGVYTCQWYRVFTFSMLVDFLLLITMALDLFQDCLEDTFLRTVRVFKLAVVLRLGRVLVFMRILQQTIVFRIIGESIKSSAKEFAVMFAIVTAASLFFGLMEHWLDRIQFQNAFTGFWWAIVTLTTCGFGDYVPATPTGMTVAAIVVTFGLLIITFAIPIAVNSFTANFEYLTSRNDIEHVLKQRLIFQLVMKNKVEEEERQRREAEELAKRMNKKSVLDEWEEEILHDVANDLESHMRGIKEQETEVEKIMQRPDIVPVDELEQLLGNMTEINLDVETEMRRNRRKKHIVAVE